MAEYLLARGAGINASPGYAHGQTAVRAAGDTDTSHQALVDWLTGLGAAAGPA